MQQLYLCRSETGKLAETTQPLSASNEKAEANSDTTASVAQSTWEALLSALGLLRLRKSRPAWNERGSQRQWHSSVCAKTAKMVTIFRECAPTLVSVSPNLLVPGTDYMSKPFVHLNKTCMEWSMYKPTEWRNNSWGMLLLSCTKVRLQFIWSHEFGIWGGQTNLFVPRA